MNSLEFNYHKPNTLEEVCNILDNSENAAIIAGGTDVLVEIKKGLRQNDDIVSLKKINELKNCSSLDECPIISLNVLRYLNQFKDYFVVANPA